jgi:NADH-quinone oxidoreductase subunit G
MRSDGIEALRNGVSRLIVVDHLAHDLGARADLVLPAAPFTEAAGTVVNNEGRAQRFEAVRAPDPPVQASWRWIRDAMRTTATQAPEWERLDDVAHHAARSVPALARLAELGPGADLRVAGARLPRALPRYSGRTAISAHLTVHEPKPPEDPDSPYSYSMEGATLAQQPALAPEFWAPGWNSVQALNRFQEEIAGTLGGRDPGVRLLEPDETRSLPEDLARSVERDAPPAESLRIVPLWHVHGSEELSALAEGPAQLAPSPYLALHPDDAAERDLAEGDTVRLNVRPGSTGDDGASPELRLRLIETLAPGTVGVPRGLHPGLNEAALSGWGRLEKGGAP